MPASNGPNLGLMIHNDLGAAHFTELTRLLRGLDALVMPKAKDKDLATPPGAPVDGDTYIVAASPTGAWVGHAGKIARWSTALDPDAWEFFTPKEGWRVSVEDEDVEYRYSGTSWVADPPGPAVGFKNYLINGDFAINQRAFAGGALAVGVYGHDRWKAGTGGANYSVSGVVVTHTSGPIVQVIEAPNLASQTVTVSVDDLTSGNLTVNIDGVIGIIVAATGRKGVSIAIPAGSTGNVTLTLTPATVAVTYKRVQVERGSVATVFEWRPPATEQMLCDRYCIVGASGVFGFGGVVTDTTAFVSIPATAVMRASPAMTVSGTTLVDDGFAGYTVTTSTLQRWGKSVGARVSMTSSGMTGGRVCFWQSNTGATVVFDAEL